MPAPGREPATHRAAPDSGPGRPAAGHLDGLDGLLSIVTGVELISEAYGATEATLVYDLHTAPAVGITQHTAEHFRLHEGRITSIALIFDSAPWQAIMSAAGPTHDGAAPAA
ncbi:hypothetical protein OG455_37140 [Kitasatospora sp. NBC_01287]|uniref:hypothetical protein n=1 Tax=Kitasatospora sp. NBC_01287 TaxID=2903573 RepID=UPI00224EFE17|nr:hypothetical protein [Kitasatospora sp. NBC_01287]MCX4751066.1 hypothetical protein [Kitasatospora sp. NBC_01287]